VKDCPNGPMSVSDGHMVFVCTLGDHPDRDISLPDKLCNFSWVFRFYVLGVQMNTIEF